MAREHSHYFRDVSHLTELDVYRVHALFGLGALDPSGALCHASKKILVAGLRGAGKSLRKDVQEAIDTLQRFLEMLAEDEPPKVEETPLPTIQPHLIKQLQQTAEEFAPLLPNLRALSKAAHGAALEWTAEDEARIDQIARSHGDGEHYVENMAAAHPSTSISAS